MMGMRALLALLLALGWLAALPVAPARAAGLVVRNVNDSGPDSLRQAMLNAEATAEADTISFDLPGGGPWTIALASNLPFVTRPLTITGPGRDRLTIDGQDAVQPFSIDTGGGAVAIERLTLARGWSDYYGGCLYHATGTVVLRDARVRDCVAAAGGGAIVQDSGALTIERSELLRNRASFEATFGGGGGAIFTNQYWGNTTLTIRDSVIAGNTATNSYGGGIHARRLMDRPDTTSPYTLTVTIERSTIGGPAPADANSADWGGGILNGDADLALTGATVSGNAAKFGGGGLYNGEGALALTNATLSGNTAGGNGGGLLNDRGRATLRFVTIVGNTAATAQPDKSGGGINFASFGDPVSLLGSIVAGNRRGAATPDDCDGAVTSQGYNLTGPDPQCPAGGTNVTYGGALAALLDPALADNGGPTPTHALAPGSPGLDRIPLDICTVGTDQRGDPRPQPAGGRCDIGAVEGAAQRLLTVATVGGGAVGRSPAGTGAGPFGYAPGTPVTLTPQPMAGQTFVGWMVDGAYKGWAPSLTLTMDAAHSVQATFVPTVGFPDVGAGRPDHAAIVALASRGTIRGYNPQRYGPDDGVQRAQMAALIARATPAGPHTPPTTLAPPACLVAGTWDCEDWGTAFTDQSGDPNLWRNAGTLQHYGVALGYTAADCAAKGRRFPCYGPSDPVTYAQTITFITRMMKVKGNWLAQPNAPLPHAGVPGPHQEDVRTFAFYAGGIPALPANWNAGATRGWFAQALWQALNSYWGSDGPLPDGRPGGGLMP